MVPLATASLPSSLLLWAMDDSGDKESACNAGDLGLIPGSGRSPGEGNGNPLQYSCMENTMDRGAWEATVHGAAKSQTQLSNFFSFRFVCFERRGCFFFLLMIIYVKHLCYFPVFIILRRTDSICLKPGSNSR